MGTIVSNIYEVGLLAALAYAFWPLTTVELGDKIGVRPFWAKFGKCRSNVVSALTRPTIWIHPAYFSNHSRLKNERRRNVANINGSENEMV